MDCSAFRDRHLAFADNVLPERELRAMQEHLATCEGCARYNTAVRRGLLVLRNLPAIEPSADFADRLNARLRRAKLADARAARYHGPSIGTFMLAASGVVAAGFLAAAVFGWPWARSTRDLRLEPVVTMRPATPVPVVSSDFMASASAGLPVWPAAMMAEQAPVHFVDAELELASLGR
jgi:predicted anti-sigma-YlaC factor YlaD